MRSSRVPGRGGGGGGQAAAAASLAALLCGLLLSLGAADAQTIRRPSAYKTLRGDAPLVIAKGGFSGVFPDSSQDAFQFALIASAPNTSLWCDVQLTKDGVGICARDVNLANCTNVNAAYPDRNNKYVIDGVAKPGYFSVDFTYSDVQSLFLTQGIWSRTEKFDFTQYPIMSVTDFQSIVNPSSVWLNVQRDIFYTRRGLNMTRYVDSILKKLSWVSSKVYLKELVPEQQSLCFAFPIQSSLILPQTKLILHCWGT